jgi:2'-5' RNA ligase
MLKIEGMEKDILDSNAHIYANIGMLLKIDDLTKNEIDLLPTPKEPNGEEITKLPADKLHITLTSIKSFKNIPNKEGFEILEIEIPKIVLGESRFVYRDESGDNRVYSPKGKTTYVVSIENQDELKKYVNALYDTMGIKNPEPDRFFHITIANNAQGNSFASIGNVDYIDFK